MLGMRALPASLKQMDTDELGTLCEEIRQEIISVSLSNGGHLGASLGAVEIAVALHRVFDSPKDKIIWDVGHQAYAHKLITGRSNRFSTLRKFGGISGFLSRDENEHDLFGAGHSSTALSAALGFCYRSETWTVAVIGDGGLSSGVSLEALNNIRSPNHKGPLLVVLNDNKMSISENVGGIHHILASGQASNFFSLFGFKYIGPQNGHDLPSLLSTLQNIRSTQPTSPILLHLETQKGKGYSLAEARPDFYHGISPTKAVVVSGKTQPSVEPPEQLKEKNWNDHFCEALLRAAEKDPKIIAITAAMADGTGLLPFASRFPDRFFDVGIAESHAVTFAAGLAANGWKPVCAIYSTFLQRSFDAIIHDVALQRLPVIFAVDRAGLVGADGPTHHGVFDLAYAGMVPGTKIFVPEVGADLEGAIQSALRSDAPSFIRYPRGKAPNNPALPYADIRGLDEDTPEVEKIILSYGPIGVRIRKLISTLVPAERKKILSLTVIEAKPVPDALLSFLEKNRSRIREAVFFEDGIRRGSLSVDLAVNLAGISTRFFTYPDKFITHGEIPELELSFGRTDAAILEAIREGL